MSDQEIIDLIRQKKFTRLGEKLYRYFPVVKKFVLKNSGTKQEAEDIYQDAIIIFIKKTEKENFELSASLETYLFSITRLLWMEQLKARSKQLQQNPEIAPINIEFDENEEKKFKFAESAILTLGAACRKLLRLFYVERRSFKEIALQMKFSTERVAKNQKYRCLEKAREEYLQLSRTGA